MSCSLFVCQVNLSNNDIASLPERLEAAWGRVDVLTGKLDPDTVGSPFKAEVVVRGNPFADATANKPGATSIEDVAMDESQ